MNDSTTPSLPYTNNARLKIRYLVINLFLSGRTRTQVASDLNVSRRLVNEWVALYLNNGIDGLHIKKAKGRSALINSKQKAVLKGLIKKTGIDESSDKITCNARYIQSFIKEQFGVEYSLRNVYYLLKTL
jgi:transposase